MEVSASFGFKQAKGDLQPELGKVQILPSTELEAGQKSGQTVSAQWPGITCLLQTLCAMCHPHLRLS